MWEKMEKVHSFLYKNTVYKNTEAEIWHQFFSENGEIFTHYKRNVCQMKQQVERSTLSIYLGVGVSGKSPKIGLEFKNISGSEKINVFILIKKKCVLLFPWSLNSTI